jgi:hypothetical protein
MNKQNTGSLTSPTSPRSLGLMSLATVSALGLKIYSSRINALGKGGSPNANERDLGDVGDDDDTTLSGLHIDADASVGVDINDLMLDGHLCERIEILSNAYKDNLANAMALSVRNSQNGIMPAEVLFIQSVKKKGVGPSFSVPKRFSSDEDSTGFLVHLPAIRIGLAMVSRGIILVAARTRPFDSHRAIKTWFDREKFLVVSHAPSVHHGLAPATDTDVQVCSSILGLGSSHQERETFGRFAREVCLNIDLKLFGDIV